MRIIKYLFLAGLLTAFGINEMNAQRRNNNSNNRDNVRTRTTRVIRTRPSIRFGINNRSIYNNRFNRFNSYYGGWYGPSYLGHRFVQVNPYGLSYTKEAHENRMEELRAYMLYKYTLKPNKRNTRRLIKYNVLTNRDANEGIK